MSAFIVEDETINSIVGTIESIAYSHNGDEWLFRPFTKLGYQINAALKSEDFYAVLKKLAEDLFKLNIDGVNARYGENQAQEFRPLDFQYKGVATSTKIKAVKAMECLQYQCSEGNVPETPLFKALDEVINNFCRHIVGRLPQYDKAKWG